MLMCIAAGCSVHNEVVALRRRHRLFIMSLFIDKFNYIVYNRKHKNKVKAVYMYGAKERCRTSTDPGHPEPAW